MLKLGGRASIITALILALSPSALAQDDDDPYFEQAMAAEARKNQPKPTQLILGFENLFGYASIKQELKRGSETATSTFDRLAFIGGGVNNPYAVPSLSFDARLPVQITLGGALHYTSASESVVLPQATDSAEVTATVSEFGLHARVGYMYSVKSAAFWPRLGLTWRSASTDGQDSDAITLSTTAIVFELPILLTGDTFGLSLGPAIYIPAGGSYTGGGTSDTSGSGDVKASVGGFAVNVSGYVFL